MNREKEQFLAAIDENPCDCNLRAIYADWLEEKGLGTPEEIDRQRNWRRIMEESRQWLTALCDRLGPSYYDSEEDYTAYAYENRNTENIRPMTYERLLEYAGLWADTETGESEWECGEYTIQWGSESWRDLFNYDKQLLADFWRHWEIATGRVCKRKSNFFSCSC